MQERNKASCPSKACKSKEGVERDLRDQTLLPIHPLLEEREACRKGTRLVAPTRAGKGLPCQKTSLLARELSGSDRELRDQTLLPIHPLLEEREAHRKGTRLVAPTRAGEGLPCQKSEALGKKVERE